MLISDDILTLVMLLFLHEKFEDTKEIISSSKQTDRQYNDQDEKKDNRTNNNLSNTTQKTKDWATRIPLKTGGELVCSGRGQDKQFLLH